MTYGHRIRVAWAPPRLDWEWTDVPLGWLCELLGAAVFRRLCQHPQLSIVDPASLGFVDGDGSVLCRDHEGFDGILRYLHFEHRRDEVLWLELSDRQGRSRTTLCVAPVDGEVTTYDSIGAASVSEAVTALLDDWLRARGLSPLSAPLDGFDIDQWTTAAAALRDLSAEVDRRRDEAEAAREQDRAAPEFGPLDVPALELIPFYQIAGKRFGVDVSSRVLDLDPSDPITRLQIAQRAGNLEAIETVIRDAPGWSQPHLAAVGVCEKDDRLRHAVTAAALDSTDVDCLIAAGDQLWNRFQRADAFRIFDRCSRLFASNLATHSKAMGVKLQIGRIGAAYSDALARFNNFPDNAGAGLFGVHPDMVWCRLRLANVFLEIGRIDEAIEIRERALASAFGNWSNQNEILDDWKGDARLRVHAYAREGFFRGDLGRCVYGAPAAPIDDTPVLTALLHSLIETGQPDIAVMAWHQHRNLTAGKTVPPDLIAARALIETGQPGEIPLLILGAQLRVPQAQHDSEIDRLLRAAVAVGHEPWAAQIAASVEDGAVSAARQLARDAADFFPEASTNPQIATWAATASAAVATDDTWWDSLRHILDDDVTSECDRFIASIRDQDLASADSAVVSWIHLSPPPDENSTVELRRQFVLRLLYVLSRAVGEYLAATTRPPSPHSGALRAIAGEVLSTLSSWNAHFELPALRAFFASLEGPAAAAGECGSWLVDRWLLRIERALRLEDRWGAVFPLLAAHAPNVASMLRGPELVSLELFEAERRAEAEPDQAAALLERCIRAMGGGHANKWSNAVAACLGETDAALDVHWLCFYAHPFNASGAVNAAKIFLARGDGQRAFDVLVARLGRAGETWRTERIAEMRELLDAHLPVPVEFDLAQTQGFEAMQAGNMEAALAPLRWCDAMDPNNEACLKNLGLANAMLGRPYEAMRYFSEASPEEGLMWAAQQLYQGGHMLLSTQVYRYLTLSPVPPVVWQQAAGIAYAAEDDETCALAYGVLDNIAPEVVGGAELNAWAGVLDNLGEYHACARVARRLSAVAGDDPMLASCADHHMACALLGLGRAADALPYAQRAIANNPLPDNAAIFAETAALCQSDGRREPMQSRRTTAAGRAQGSLVRGEAKEILDNLGGDEGWDVRRVALAATRYRYGSEDDVRVPPRAVAMADSILADSAGALDVNACLARAAAARVREDALFPIDAPPGLGRRIEREQIAHLLGQDLDQVRLELGSDGSDEDVELFAGQPAARLSDFAQAMAQVLAGDLPGAMAGAGVDLAGWAQVGKRWGDALADDTALTAQFRRRVGAL